MKESELLKRVFKQISRSHFRDHKLIRNYCTPISFDRSLGDDIAEYIKNIDNEYYEKKRIESEKD